jgi:hypothetical protein
MQPREMPGDELGVRFFVRQFELTGEPHIRVRSRKERHSKR